MSLPMAGARPMTHKQLPLGRLMALADELESVVAERSLGPLTPEMVADLCPDLDAKPVEIYAAAALMTPLVCDASAPVRVELCIGGCQGWGAGEVLDKVLERRPEGGYGVVAQRCLDRCDGAPVVIIHTPSGSAVMPRVTLAQLDEALTVLMQG